MKRLRSLDEWIAEYKRTAGEWEVSDVETVWFRPEYGFFTWCLDWERKWMVVPKMCGDGRLMRKVIYDMMTVCRPYGFEGVLFCTRKHVKAYLRVLGGKLLKTEATFNTRTKRDEPIHYILVSWEDVVEKGGAVL